MKRIIECPECHQTKEHYGRGYCRRCYMRLFQDAKYREKHKEQIAQINERYYENHGFELKAANKKRRESLRSEMIKVYGGKCVCCGENNPAFLTLDHVYGGGSKHQKRLGSSEMVLRELRKLDWPKEEYQILCANCNMAKARFGKCPHQI